MENEVKQIKKAPPKPMPPRPVPPKKVQSKAEESKREILAQDGAQFDKFETKVLSRMVEQEPKQKKEIKRQELKTQEKTKFKNEGKEQNYKIRKKGKTKKGLIVLIAIIIILALCGGIIAMVIMNKENNKKLVTPTLSVVQLYNGTVLEVEEQAKATKYEFIITDSNGTESSFTTSTNSIELNQYLNQPGEFSVKARVYGVGSGATSDLSESKSFINYVSLSTPNVFINNMDKILEGGAEVGYKTNTNKDDDTITWEAVKNAHKYYVRYGVDSQTNTVKYMEVDAVAGVVTFQLSNIYAKGTGKYLISVIAVPEGGDNCYYLESDYQKLISIEYYEKQSAPTSVTYVKTTKELQFTLNETDLYGTEFDLFITYIDGTTKEHKIYLNDATVTTSGGIVTIECNLEQVAAGDISTIAIVTLSDGPYSTDSDPYVWANN